MYVCIYFIYVIFDCVRCRIASMWTKLPLQQLECWIPPPRIEPSSAALKGGFFTTGPPVEVPQVLLFTYTPELPHMPTSQGKTSESKS